MNQKLSLCIPTYNRRLMCWESFRAVAEDDRIDDIVILDDASTDGSGEWLRLKFMGIEKIRVVSQAINVGMHVNKKDAIKLAKNEWVIIFDDDNKIGPDYLDALFAVENVFEEKAEIFAPEKGLPHFDYSEFSEHSIHRNNIREYADKKMFGALLNTSNYVVNRDFFLENWTFNSEIKGTDTVWHALSHLKNFGSFYIVPGMHYHHLVHKDSGFMKDIHYNMAKATEIEKIIKSL